MLAWETGASISISIWDEGIVGQPLQPRKKEVDASKVQLSEMFSVKPEVWRNDWLSHLSQFVRAILSPHLGCTFLFQLVG